VDFSGHSHINLIEDSSVSRHGSSARGDAMKTRQ
jgi:hypothetical protein